MSSARRRAKREGKKDVVTKQARGKAALMWNRMRHAATCAGRIVVAPLNFSDVDPCDMSSCSSVHFVVHVCRSPGADASVAVPQADKAHLVNAKEQRSFPPSSCCRIVKGFLYIYSNVYLVSF